MIESVTNKMNIPGAVSHEYGISEQDLHQKSKKRKITEPRMITIALIVATGQAQQKDMATEFNLESATICHAVNTVRSMVRLNAKFRGRIVAILTNLSDSKPYRESIMERLLSVSRN